jgi:hypothetical protein
MSANRFKSCHEKKKPPPGINYFLRYVIGGVWLASCNEAKEIFFVHAQNEK